MHVSYVQEIPAEYGAALDKAETVEQLRKAVRLYGEVAADAMDIAEKMSVADFDDWRAALRKERRGTFMGDEAMDKFGALLMPEVMMKVSIVADKFGTPWGCAYIRLKEVGKLSVGKNGVATISL